MKPHILQSPVEHLSVEEARQLLKNGIPRSELQYYKCTVYASNASFWDYLKMLEVIDKIEVIDDIVFFKSTLSTAVAA